VSNFGQENIFIENANARIPNSSYPGFFAFSLLISICLRRGVRLPLPPLGSRAYQFYTECYAQQIRMVAGPRNQFIFLVHKGLLVHGSPFSFLKRPRRVQNFSQLGRNSHVVFLRHVAVNAQSHLGIAVAKSLLPQFQRHV
jgi:hypothetical protein